MRETHQPPTTSPAGHPHDHTHPRLRKRLGGGYIPTGHPHSRAHPRHSRAHPRHSRAHPRYSRVHLRHSRAHPRHSRVGGNPPRFVQTPGASAPSRRLQNSTQSNRIRQNPTETRVRAFLYSRARAREAPHPPPSFPRRRESLLPTWIAPKPQQIQRVAWIRRPIAAMPIHQTEPMGLPQCGNPSAYPEWAPPAKSIRDVLEHRPASPAGGSPLVSAV